MSRRDQLAHAFEHTSLPHGDDGRRMPGILAPCGTCGTKGQLVVNTIGNSVGNDVDIEWQFISRKLQAQGWRIGRRRQDHRCPRCVEIERLTKVGHRPTSVKETAMNSTTVMPPKVLKLADTKPAEPTMISREMTREDRRIIFAKLEEVYVDDKTGYGDGWSDEKVALNLGVPRAWVRLIRDENFGDELTNENVRERVKEAHELLAKINALRPHFDEAKKLFGLADAMERELAQIAKVMK